MDRGHASFFSSINIDDYSAHRHTSHFPPHRTDSRRYRMQRRGLLYANETNYLRQRYPGGRDEFMTVLGIGQRISRTLYRSGSDHLFSWLRSGFCAAYTGNIYRDYIRRTKAKTFKKHMQSWTATTGMVSGTVKYMIEGSLVRHDT